MVTHLSERDADATPLISVVMANFEAGDKIVHALHSVLRQSVSDIEVIVSDDGSRDDSLDHVRRLMEVDPRIRIASSEQNSGPARCRNRALDMARGRWIAIVDSDDIIHPERFERLLAAAEAHGADMVADDLLLFYEDGTAPRLMLGDDAEQSFVVSTERWLLAGVDGSPALGYLKPLIFAERLKTLRYDESLRIGEDFDLVLRLLLQGAKLLVVPEPFYLYRRHSGSISHRLSVADMEAMVARQEELAQAHAPLEAGLAAAFKRRLDTLKQGLGYERLVASIKSRRVGSALSQIVRDPAHLGRLWSSFAEGRQRRTAPVAIAPSPVLVLGAATGQGDAVPVYTPIAMTDWSAPRPRNVWRNLAAQRGMGAVRCIPLDAAGHYAAGFIPEAIVAAPELLREAS